MGCSSSAPLKADDVTLTKKDETTTGAGTRTAAANPDFDAKWPAYEAKMKKEGLSDAAIAAFKYNFGVLTSGADLMIPEASVLPVESLPEE